MLITSEPSFTNRPMAGYRMKFSDNRDSGKAVLRQAQLVMLEILRLVDDICQEHGIQYWLDGGTALGVIRHKGFIPWDDDLDICMLRKDYNRFLSIAENKLPENLFLQVFQKDIGYCLHWAKIRDKCSLMEEAAYKNAKFHKGISIDIIPCDFFPDSKFMSNVEKCLAKAFRYRGKNLHNNMHFLEKINYAASKCLCFIIPVNMENRLFSMFKRLFRKNRSWIGYGIGTPFTGRYAHDTIFPLQQMMFEGDLFPVPNKVDRYLTALYGDYKKQPAPAFRKPHAIKIEFRNQN